MALLKISFFKSGRCPNRDFFNLECTTLEDINAPKNEVRVHRINLQARVVINNQTDADHIFKGLPVLPPFKVEG